MKKNFLTFFIFLVSLLALLGFSSCNDNNDNTVKYIYTNSQGEVSYFEIDFDKNEYTYCGNACYREGWGYMLIPNTSYEVSGDIRLDYKMNGYTVYEFLNHPWNNEYPMGITSDGNILRIQWTTFFSYDFVKEGYTNNSNKDSTDSASNSQNQSGNESTGNENNIDNSSEGNINNNDSSTENQNPEPAFYDVTFWYYAGKMPETVTVMENTVLKLPEFEEKGYTFDGWRINEQLKQAGDTVTITENTDIYAQWTENRYTITYNLNGGQMPHDGVMYEYAIYNLPYHLPIPQGTNTQSFVKWTTDEAGKNEIKTITELGNYTLYAHYEDSAKCLTYKYSEELQGYEVIDYTGNAKEVKIPSTYKGVAVKRIGNSAFSDCTSLTSVTIPDSVTSIGEWAFGSCSSLTSIEIPDGVTLIAYRAFSGCSSLTSIEIPDGVTLIDSFAFIACSSLTSIEIPDGVTSIDSFAFANCNSLTSVTIPDSVTSIGECAFGSCSSLTSIEIPDSVREIYPTAFNNCLALKTIIIDSSDVVNVSFIGDIITYATDVYIRADITITVGIYNVLYNNLGKDTINGVEYYHYQIKGE